MEPERKLEKLLRAYAKKRRTDAGDAFKLHPATRRLLQSEMARNAPKPDEEESLSLWELFRQQWALLLGFAVIVFFGAALFLPALSSAKKKAQDGSAMNNLKQIGTAAQMVAEENNGKLPTSLDSLTNQLGSDKLLTDTESGKRFVYIAGGENLDSLPSNSVLAYSPADNKGRAVLFADGRVEVVKDSQFSELTNPELLQLALKDSSRRRFAEMPATTTVASGNANTTPPFVAGLKSEANRNESKPADAGIAAGNIELAANVPAPAVDRRVASKNAINNFAATQADSFRFASAVSHNLTFSLQNSFKNTIKPVQASPVLSNFQVQQNGSAIRVVDADGSVYNGSLQSEISAAQSAMPSGTPGAPSAAPAQVQQQKEITRGDESQSAQNYFFRVSGLNQTLQQNVVFIGSLLAISNVSPNLPPSFSGSGSIGGGGGQSQSMLTNQLPWSNSRIAGTAVIADTNNIEINAVPLPP